MGGSGDTEDTVCGALGKFFREGNSTKVQKGRNRSQCWGPRKQCWGGAGKGPGRWML